MSDPIIKYHGFYFNYYDIADGLYSMWICDGKPGTNDDYEIKNIKNYLDDCIFGGYKFRTIKKLVESY